MPPNQYFTKEPSLNRVKHNQWKELTILILNEMTLEPHLLDESLLRYLTLKIPPNSWQGSNQHFFNMFCEYAITQQGSHGFT